MVRNERAFLAVLCFIFSVLRGLFFLCSFVCSLLFECQKVAKTCVTRKNHSQQSLVREFFLCKNITHPPAARLVCLVACLRGAT